MSAAEPPPPAQRFGDLKTRILSALAAAAVGVTLLYLGGVWTLALVALACGVMTWEWRSVTLHDGGPCDAGAAPMIAAVAAAAAAGHFLSLPAGFAVLGLGMAGVLMVDMSRTRRRGLGWSMLGMAYLGTAGLSFLYLRADPEHGFAAALWLFLVVAAADIGGYFAGRTFGGPKLWPRVSPKKTWSGSLGGIALAVVAGVAFSLAAGGSGLGGIAVAAAAMAAVSQAGDLAESAIKRHFAVKDAGRILPGHGGALDRFDGLIAAAVAAALVTWLRGEAVIIW